MVTLLLSHGADVNARDNNGMTPLHDAAREGHSEVVTLLLSHGADVNARDNNGRTPLYFSLGSPPHYSVAELLISHGSDVNIKLYDGSTPLHVAVKNMKAELITLLLSHGADVNARDNDGRTPLHDAALRSQDNVIKLLLDHNADPSIRDRKGLTPVSLYLYNGNSLATFKLMLEKGGEISGDYARVNGHFKDLVRRKDTALRLRLGSLYWSNRSELPFSIKYGLFLEYQRKNIFFDVGAGFLMEETFARFYQGTMGFYLSGKEGVMPAIFLQLLSVDPISFDQVVDNGKLYYLRPAFRLQFFKSSFNNYWGFSSEVGLDGLGLDKNTVFFRSSPYFRIGVDFIMDVYLRKEVVGLKQMKLPQAREE